MRELIVIGLMEILVLAGGFYPGGVLDPTHAASEDWPNALLIR